MNTHHKLIPLCLIVMVMWLPVWANSEVSTTNMAAPKSYIVTLRRTTDQEGCAQIHRIHRNHIFRHAINGFTADLDAATVQKLKHDPQVLAVELDGQIAPCDQTIPSGIVRMGLTNFPMTRQTGTDQRINVDVAVMDTGIQTNHPDLNVVQWVDFTGDGYGGDDWSGHGTHVAGIIGALDNDIGVVGVAPGVRLWSVQVVGPVHHNWSTFIAGCDYIITHADEISVVNASLGGLPNPNVPYIAIQMAVSNVVSQGIVFVAAAGNDAYPIEGSDATYGTFDDFLPAALPEVMAVSAMDPTNDLFWGASNFSFIPKPCPVISPGAGIDVAAPGVDILSTYVNSSYTTMTGTSMASPHVAGLVALYIAANGRAHSLQDTYTIRQAIIDHSQPQSQWMPNGNSFDPTNNPTGDSDGNPEPLAFPSESWVPNPDIQSVVMTNGGFALQFLAVPGYQYTAQYADSPNSSNQWTNLATLTGTGSVATVTLTDTNLTPMRLYRLSRH
jgi:subtilisin